MKKLIFIFLTLAAFSCGDQRSSERDDNTLNNDMDNTEMAEPDTTDVYEDRDLRDENTMESDTTTNDMGTQSDSL